MPGDKNKTADYKSRNFKVNTEWQLESTIFSQVVKTLSCNPDIDLFSPTLILRWTSMCLSNLIHKVLLWMAFKIYHGQHIPMSMLFHLSVWLDQF